MAFHRVYNFPRHQYNVSRLIRRFRFTLEGQKMYRDTITGAYVINAENPLNLLRTNYCKEHLHINDWSLAILLILKTKINTNFDWLHLLQLYMFSAHLQGQRWLSENGWVFSVKNWLAPQHYSRIYRQFPLWCLNRGTKYQAYPVWCQYWLSRFWGIEKTQWYHCTIFSCIYDPGV